MKQSQFLPCRTLIGYEGFAGVLGWRQPLPSRKPRNAASTMACN
jgi:hypothetical protein